MDSLPPAGTVAEMLAFTPKVASPFVSEGIEVQGWAICCETHHMPRVSFPALYIQSTPPSPPLEINPGTS